MTPLAVRAHPLVLGVVLFLSSELMLFASLFATYYELRSRNAVWPPHDVRLDVASASVGTVALAVSSAVMFLVTRAMDRGNDRAARWWIVSGIICALAFVYIAIDGYSKNTFTMSSSSYGSIYYVLTGTHLAHVIAGVGVLVALALGIRSPALRTSCRAGAEAMMYYWHFVFIVWIGIFATIYVVR
jgi:cytochrome c oxidase subunit 3